MQLGRTTVQKSSPGFVASPSSVVRGGGYVVDETKLTPAFRSSKFIVKANGSAAIGATSITVDALPHALNIGDLLNFGEYAPVTVTANGAALAAATSITVDALTGPIPAGALLDFSGTGELVKVTTAAAEGDTSLVVEALDAAIEDNDTATFNGGTIMARVTAYAAAAATTVTVDNLQFLVADNAEAIVGGDGDFFIPAGTIMAQLSGGKIIPRSLVTGSETAIGILIDSYDGGQKSAAATGHGLYLGGVFFTQLLPENAETDFDTWIGEIRDAGGSVILRTYSDSRAS